MKSYAVAMALVGLAVASPTAPEAATNWYKTPFRIPDGLDLDYDNVPYSDPPESHISLWHAPHTEVDIDDCDDHQSSWHWVHPAKRAADTPPPPPQKWTTSTVTMTKTVTSCAPTVTCPADKPPVVTVTKTTTVCPVPVTGIPQVPAPPPKTTSVVTPPPPKPTTVGAPPAPPAAPKTTPAPPAPTPKITTPGVTVPPATTVGTISAPRPTPTTTRAIVTAGAVQNAQRAGGALAAVALAAAALM